jgi:hypothetical protein
MWFDESDIKNPILKAFDGTNWVPVANPNIESTDPDDKSLTAEEIAEPYIDVTSKPKAQSKSIESSKELKDIPDTANRMFYQEEIIDQPKKKT